MARRTKAEMGALDLKIRPLYERGLGCRVIGEVLEENPVTILKRVRKMGIDRDRKEAQAAQVPCREDPFTNDPRPESLRWSGVGTAIRWFMSRGYMVSLPVEPAVYDLVVDASGSLVRVQVKTTNSKEKSGNWTAGISRHAYDADVTPNAGGKFRATPYSSDQIDYFFIVTGDRSCFLIPIAVVEGQLNVTLDVKYGDFKVSDRGGTVDAVG